MMFIGPQPRGSQTSSLSLFCVPFLILRLHVIVALRIEYHFFIMGLFSLNFFHRYLNCCFVLFSNICLYSGFFVFVLNFLVMAVRCCQLINHRFLWFNWVLFFRTCMTILQWLIPLLLSVSV